MQVFKIIQFFLFFFVFLLNTNLYSEDDTATAKLVSEYAGINESGSISLGLILEPKPGWHVYWKYAGDYGSAPKFDISFNGKKIKPKIYWPTPEIIRGKNYVNYGYSKKTIYLIEHKRKISIRLMR